MTLPSHAALLLYVIEWAIRLVMLVVVPLRRPPEAARSWLLLILFLPIPGLILYRLIGRSTFPRWRLDRFGEAAPARLAVADSLPRASGGGGRVGCLAERLGGFPAVAGATVELLPEYDAAIARLVADIDGAHIRVHLLTYIFADDATGRTIADALGRAVVRGVEVRVLIDALGSRPWARRTLAILAARSIPARLALPVRWWSLRRTRADLRNHRKLAIIDGATGYIGSQNIVDRDFRPGIVNDELVARVEGPVAAALDAVFASDWYLETHDALAPLPVAVAAGDAVTQPMPSGPDYRVPGFERLLVELIHDATEQVTLVSPYLVPDESLIGAMQSAVLRGVGIDLIVSAVVDQRLVNLAQRSYYAELLAIGVRIHRYRDHLLHAKHASVDDRIGVIGSGNADIRSFTLNAEASLILHGGEPVAALREQQAACLARSDMLDAEAWSARPRVQRLIENLARMVGPLL